MRILGKIRLEKYKHKNKGNSSLCIAITQLIEDIESNNWENQIDLIQLRNDADCVHSDGFYFFDIATHRTMILINFYPDGEAQVVWVGNHSEYKNIFKNNKRTIKNYLKSKDWI